MSGRTSARSTVAEQRFRRLLRAYPSEWRAEHGEAVLGTLLDAAEARGESGPTPAAGVALVREGFHQRLRRTLSTEVRGTVASVALGIGVGFTLGYFLIYSWVRPDFYSGRVIAGPVWFLPAWLLLAACTLRGRGPLRLVAWMLTTTVLLSVPLLQLGPFPNVLRTGGFEAEDSSFDPRFGSPGMLIPADAGNVAVLLFLALLTLVGEPRRRAALIGAGVAGVLSAAAFFGTVHLGHSVGTFSDAYLWRWNPLRRPAEGIGVPALAIATVLLVASPFLRRRPAASLLCLLGALLLVTGVVASALAGPVPSGD